MKRLAEVARAGRFQAMQPAADITERQALDAAIKRAIGSAGFVHALGAMVADCLTAEERGIVLPPPCESTLTRHHHGDSWADITDNAGWECYFYRVYEGRRAGIWCGSESRLDSTGKKWVRRFESAIVNDFGDLVEVSQ